jgi:inositol oxygenase
MATTPVPLSAAPIELITSSEFRNYVSSPYQDRVSQFYYQNHLNQSLAFVLKQKEKYLKLDHFEMSVWDAVEMLNEVVDQR